MFLAGLWLGFVAGYAWAAFLQALYEPRKAIQASNGKERSMDTQQWRDVYLRGSHE